MLIIVASVNLTILMNIDMLLKLLERVLRSVGQGVEAGMHVIRGQVSVRHHAVRGQGIVCREAVEGIRKHHECLARVFFACVEGPARLQSFLGCGESVKSGGEMSWGSTRAAGWRKYLYLLDVVPDAGLVSLIITGPFV
jgi:hypothetical protein